MTSIKEIKAPIAAEMQRFEPYFKKTLNSQVPLLDTITNYIFRRKGKQMRPMFVFLTAKMLGQVTESTYNAATFIELLHTATLVHDDVVDDSFQRRGFFSINALWRSKLAVLVGDFLLSKGLLLATEKNEFDLLRIVSEAVREMSEGELLQIEKARKLDITEDIYFEVIRKKTATLIASCTAIGAKSVGADDALVERMRLFGEYIGIAFQMRDDIFDYEKKSITGKPSGNDLKEKKMTLPLIHVLLKLPTRERRKIIRLIRTQHNNPQTVEFIINKVKEEGGISYTHNLMEEYKNKALKLLEDITESEAKSALINLVNYSISRNK